MIEDLVIHIGDCKTGTTSIQSVLSEERVHPTEGGLVYPAVFNHIPVAAALRREAGPRARRFGKLAHDLRNASARTGIVSAEHFEFVDPQRLDDALREFMPRMRDQVRIIGYVRPHAERLLSSFAERTKKGNSFKTMAGFHKKLTTDPLLYYAPRMRRWREVFGERYTVRPMIRSRLADGDVVVDFFDFAFGRGAYRIEGPTRVNEALSIQDLAMLRTIHRRIRQLNTSIGQQQQSLGWNIAPMLAEHSAPLGIKPALHRQLAEDVAQVYRSDAEACDAEFMDGTPLSEALDHAVEKAIEEPQSLAAETYFDALTIAQFHGLADMFCRIMESDPKGFLWATRPANIRRERPELQNGDARPPAREGGRKGRPDRETRSGGVKA